MSDELRDALRRMKAKIDSPRLGPVTYLHDPETGRPFAALVTLEIVERIEGWDPMAHDHLEGDDDEAMA